MQVQCLFCHKTAEFDAKKPENTPDVIRVQNGSGVRYMHKDCYMAQTRGARGGYNG